LTFLKRAEWDLNHDLLEISSQNPLFLFFKHLGVLREKKGYLQILQNKPILEEGIGESHWTSLAGSCMLDLFPMVGRL